MASESGSAYGRRAWLALGSQNMERCFSTKVFPVAEMTFPEPNQPFQVLIILMQLPGIEQEHIERSAGGADIVRPKVDHREFLM